MDWLPGYAAGLDASTPDRKAQFDYSYLVGHRPAGVRHEPHVHAQQKTADAGLLATLDLMRDRSSVEQPKT